MLVVVALTFAKVVGVKVKVKVMELTIIKVVGVKFKVKVIGDSSRLSPW